MICFKEHLLIDTKRLSWPNQSCGKVDWFFADHEYFSDASFRPVASFAKEVNLRLAECQLKTNGRLVNLGLTFLIKEATVAHFTDMD